MSSDNTVTVTVVAAGTGQSESLPLDAAATKVSDLADWCKALFGFSDGATVRLAKDGRAIPVDGTMTLQRAGIRHGDVLLAAAVAAAGGNRGATATAATAAGTPAAAPAAAAAAAGGGGLDFSNLLAAAPAAAAAAAAPPKVPEPAYYPGMHLQDAMEYNPHPAAFVKLLQSKEHLFKELNYHNPVLADKLRNQSLPAAVEIWKEEMVKTGIQGAVQSSQRFHTEQEMTRRLQANPDDAEAAAYFEKKQAKSKVQQQFRKMMQEYPESLGRVLMLYIEAKINGHAVQAFCDSGAQSTIMSKKLATECGLMDLIDDQFAGTAVGVGTGKILGRIHIVQLQIGDTYFPCSLTVMDDPVRGASEMPFLLGLDMMKRHLCQIDLAAACIRFRIGPDQYMDAPFLHEKDLDESKGGTKGFDADAANRELMELQRKRQEDNTDKDKDKNGKDKDDDDHNMEES